MTYARARLWLGICGVGTTVVVCVAMVVGKVPYAMFPDTTTWRFMDVLSLVGFVVGFLIFMLPFDLLGGYVLPRLHTRQSQSFTAFARQWMIGVATQSTLFVLTGLAILAGGRAAGVLGTIVVIAGSACIYLFMQGLLARVVMGGVCLEGTLQLEAVWRELESWGLQKPKILVAKHADVGFTGGVVGCPGLETFIIPRRWLEVLSMRELAVAIARRKLAVETGSRLRGLLVAITWVLSGFMIATLMPGAGVRSIAQLVTTFCGFTFWMFFGLLILPTVSRLASYTIDKQVVGRGVPEDLLGSTLQKLDRLQDDESRRPAWIENIFHPVPSLDNRRDLTGGGSPGAWHAARMMLFLSWSCLGLLSRAVHCNAGRPELWVLLPTD